MKISFLDIRIFLGNLFYIDWIDTFRINSKLPWKIALYLPIWVYKCKIESLKGSINIDSDYIKSGMIRLGQKNSPLFHTSCGFALSLSRGGKMIFKGPGMLGMGSAIEIGSNGKIEFGRNFGITATFRIISRKEIIIGDNFSCAWDVNISDTDFHEMYDVNTCHIFDTELPIKIGDDVWVCQRCLILKGSNIPTRSIIAANSLVNRSLRCNIPNTLYGGIPARTIKEGITRKDFIDFESNNMLDISRGLRTND
jgi:acetyltransferase-like isoleucine patch superfamily enzyme